MDTNHPNFCDTTSQRSKANEYLHHERKKLNVIRFFLHSKCDILVSITNDKHNNEARDKSKQTKARNESVYYQKNQTSMKFTLAKR